MSPLRGIRVLEVSTAIQGPAAAQFLADVGAEVIRVEPPIGDASRYVVRTPALPEMGSQYLSVNRGKRSVSVDAYSLGHAVLQRLAASASPASATEKRSHPARRSPTRPVR
jgi:crotonobetainyl-CoA:carnitine CoA-transferase CaiB-like acyl-CoA transferase